MTFISIACWTMGILAYLAGSWAMAYGSIEVVRLGENKTMRSKFLFPEGYPAERDELLAHLAYSADIPLGYYIRTVFTFLPRLFHGLLDAPPILWDRLSSLKIKRKPKPPKVRVVESDADQTTSELLDERMKLGAERFLLQMRLPEVELRISEIDAQLNESDYRDAPRSAKSQAT